MVKKSTKVMKSKDLSKKIYIEADKKGKRGYRLEYLEDWEGKVTLEWVTLIEKNGQEAYLTMADMVTFVFAGIDEQMEKAMKEEKKNKKIKK